MHFRCGFAIYKLKARVGFQLAALKSTSYIKPRRWGKENMAIYK